MKSSRCHGVHMALLLECQAMAFVLNMYKRNADPWYSRIHTTFTGNVATALLALVPGLP